MIQLLEAHQYQKVHALFQGPQLSLVIDAATAGNSPNTIWVDNVAQPKTALLWDNAHCYYLVGAADNPELNQALASFVTESLVPEAATRDLGVFKVYYSSEGWEDAIRLIFESPSLTKLERSFYTFDQVKLSNWREWLPNGGYVRSIDQRLWANPRLKNLQAVTEEIESGWHSLRSFLEKGFGFCLLLADEIVCWCTAEYVSEKKCGIGIETVEAYRQRGLATLTACAFVEYCVSKQITPHWDAWTANLPSIAVAEKVGFRRRLDYTVYFGQYHVAKAA